MNAYNDVELTAFCMFNFEKVYNNFANGQSKQQKAVVLIDYCNKNLEIDTLLDLLQSDNEDKYQHYMPYF